MHINYSTGEYAVTASKRAKDFGLKSLNQMSDLTGRSPQTLINWYRNQPMFFDVVLLGCKAKLEAQRIRETIKQIFKDGCG